MQIYGDYLSFYFAFIWRISRITYGFIFGFLLVSIFEKMSGIMAIARYFTRYKLNVCQTFARHSFFSIFMLKNLHLYAKWNRNSNNQCYERWNWHKNFLRFKTQTKKKGLNGTWYSCIRFLYTFTGYLEVKKWTLSEKNASKLRNSNFKFKRKFKLEIFTCNVKFS